MNITRKKKIIGLWCLSVLSGAVSLTGLAFLSVTDSPSALFRLLATYKLIHENYFRDISDDTLLDGAAKGMVAALDDKHSALLMGDELSGLLRQMNGEYSGIGVVIGADGSGAYRVMAVFPESSAEKAGLEPGDEILSVDGKPAAEMDIEAAANAIRGESGTTVSLEIRRRDGAVLAVTADRGQVNMPTVDGEMLEDGIGYIHIFSFAAHTPEEFRKEYSRLASQGMEKLVVDVRGNPGGVIESVVGVADQILSNGTVVSFVDKHGNRRDYAAEGTDHRIPLAVLIDKNSASASEILAGAVQDKKEGTVIGETSYGKGTVQSVITISSREAIKVSIAEYLTAAGRKIDKVGIEPDIPAAQTGQAFDPASDSVLQRAVSFLKTQ